MVLTAIKALLESDKRIRISILLILPIICIELVVLDIFSVFKIGILDSFAVFGDRL